MYLTVTTNSGVSVASLKLLFASDNLKRTFGSKRLYWNLHILYSLRGYYTPNQNLACFVLYLKIINNFMKIIVWML